MEKIQILIVGTDERIVKTIAKLINKDERWLAVVAQTLTEAESIILSKALGLVLLGAGLKDSEEEFLKQLIEDKKLVLPLVKHYGGGSGLLYAEIYQAIGTGRAAR